jgi:hypothetical protein
MLLLDGAQYPLRDADADRSGYYFAATCGNPEDSTREWAGAVLYQDTDGAGDLRPVATAAIAATKGSAITALASATGLDTTNTVRVKLTYGTIESITDGTFTNTETENLFVLGGEVVQVRDVTPLGGNEYDLSHMKRGLRGTEGKVGTHAVGEDFLVVNNAIQFVPVESGDVGTFNFAAVTTGQDVTDVNPGDPGYKENFEIS